MKKKAPLTVAIVPAGREDAFKIAAMGKDIWQRCYFPEVLSLDAVHYLWRRSCSPQAIREEMAQGVVYEWIRLAQARIGFLAWHHLSEQRRMRLNKLYLLPEYHHQGIGALALTHVKAVAARLGVSEIYLYVFKKNRKAIRAYLKAGFVIAGEEISDAGQGYCYDDYVMRCCL
ncbi:hypothetical protein JCM13664_00840 [Methylothermus subterraneus]